MVLRLLLDQKFVASVVNFFVIIITAAIIIIIWIIIFLIIAIIIIKTADGSQWSLSRMDEQDSIHLDTLWSFSQHSPWLE